MWRRTGSFSRRAPVPHFTNICRCARRRLSRAGSTAISYGPLLDIFMLDMRSYRGPNGEDKQETYGPDEYFLGPAQVAWLKHELLSSQATWKVIAADMPLSLVVIYD